MAFIGRLNYEPRSVWRAKSYGGTELKDYAKYIGWDAQTYVLADLYDAIQVNTATLVQINSDPKSTPPEPKPYPRPGDKESAPVVGSLADFGVNLANMFGPGHF